jgi:hypothetical protein
MTNTFGRALCALALTLMVAAPAAAQSTGAKEKEKHDMSKVEHSAMAGKDHMGATWKEMDTFHTLLGATFHPVAKDSLQPLRDKVSDLAAAAKAWSASTPPASCNSDDVRKAVGALSTDAESLAAQVKRGARDGELKKSITALHELFESVEKKCGGHDAKEMKH